MNNSPIEKLLLVKKVPSLATVLDLFNFLMGNQIIFCFRTEIVGLVFRLKFEVKRVQHGGKSCAESYVSAPFLRSIFRTLTLAA